MKMQKKKQITLREWIAKYKDGEFTDNVTRESLIAAGWLDYMSDLPEMAEYNIQVGELLESITNEYFLNHCYVYFKEQIPAEPTLESPYVIIHLKPKEANTEFNEIVILLHCQAEGVDYVVYELVADIYIAQFAQFAQFCTNDVNDLVDFLNENYTNLSAKYDYESISEEIRMLASSMCEQVADCDNPQDKEKALESFFHDVNCLRRKANWLIVDEEFTDLVTGECENCGFTELFEENGIYKFCPECGKPMNKTMKPKTRSKTETRKVVETL